jgi:hypothetical protein
MGPDAARPTAGAHLVVADLPLPARLAVNDRLVVAGELEPQFMVVVGKATADARPCTSAVLLWLAGSAEATGRLRVACARNWSA